MLNTKDINFRELGGAVNGTIENGDNATPQIGVNWTPATVCLSLSLFLLAGLFEIGGGWLVFVGMREREIRKPMYLYLIFGSLVLVAYGFIPTLQPSATFGRIFAVYGGFFIVLSYLWGYLVDGMKLDLGDFIGCSISIVGVLIAWFWPR